MATDPAEILRQRDAEVARIRGFVDLTEEAKGRRIAEVNEQARAEHAEAREAGERERAERLERTEKAVFRVPVSATATDAEEAQIHAAYRAAYSDVYSSTASLEGLEQAEEELGRILRQAEPRAAVHRSREEAGDDGLVPRAAGDGIRLAGHHRQRNASDPGGRMTLCATLAPMPRFRNGS